MYSNLYACTYCRYVVGGLRKKLDIEWDLPSTNPRANSLPTTPISVLPSNLRQRLSNTNIVDEHKRILPANLNMSSTNKTSVLSNIIGSRNAHVTKPLLPSLVPTSITNSFNKILNSQFKENILSHSAMSKVSGFNTVPETIQSLAHNRLLKAILPASNQIFTQNTATETKSLQCITSTKNFSTSTSTQSIHFNTNNVHLLNLISGSSNTNSHHQGHVDENSSKIFCYWEDCKRYIHIFMLLLYYHTTNM